MKKENSTDYINQDAKECVVRLLPPEVKVTSQDQKFLDEFLAIVEKNLADWDLDIKAICKKLVISRTTLFRKLKQITGTNPNEFIQLYRLERAAQLLRDNFGNVTEVAEAVGFSDPYYFSKCFKKKFGQPPKPYQQEHLKKSEGEPNAEQTSEAKTGLLTAHSIGVFDRELFARGAQVLGALQTFFKTLEGIPQYFEAFKFVIEIFNPSLTKNNEFSNYSDNEITQKIRQMIDDEVSRSRRSGIYSDDRLDLFDIVDDRVRSNALAVAVVCMYVDLLPGGGGYFQLKVKNYGKVFNLHLSEPFYNQPVAAGPMCTGVLVGKDVIATAAHFINGKNITDLRFVFDYVMQDPISPVEQIPEDNIYKGVEILERVHNPESDWMLIRLDRNVSGREIAVLSQRNIFYEQPVYVMGHPCGLPLKYAPGATIDETTKNYFRADLDVYSGNSGSPVFCAETHELLGIVSRGKAADFRWTEDGWITLRYPKSDPDYKGSQCSRASEFGKLLT